MTFDMASFLPPENVLKRRLINTPMYVYCIQNKSEYRLPEIVWAVENFFKLGKIAVCTRKVKELGWDLKLTKKRENVVITCNTNDWGGQLIPNCYILYHPKYVSDPFCINRVSTGIYEVNIPPRELRCSKNWFLHQQGSFLILFQIDERGKNYLYASSYKEDCYFLLGMELTPRRMTDFTIHAEGNSVRCHKALLAKRSLYFFEYFKESYNNQNEMVIEVAYKTLSMVISYLYSGEFPTTDLAEAIDIIKLTWQLEIMSLMYLCETFISVSVNAGNVHLIREEGIKAGIAFMVGTANIFLRNIGKEVP